MTPATAALIREKTLSVWVKADIKTTLERVTRNIEKRPMLAQEIPRKFWSGLSKNAILSMKKRIL